MNIFNITFKITLIAFLGAGVLVACTKDDFLLNRVHPDKLFYYTDTGEKIPVYKVDEKLYIVYFSSEEGKIRDECEKAGITIVHVEPVRAYTTYIKDGTARSGAQITNLKMAIIEGNITKANAVFPATFYWAPLYYTENRNELVFTELFGVKMKPKTKLSQLEKLARRYVVEMVGIDKYDSQMFFLICSNRSKGNSIEVANRFYESNLFVFSNAGCIIHSQVRNNTNL